MHKKFFVFSFICILIQLNGKGYTQYFEAHTGFNKILAFEHKGKKQTEVIKPRDWFYTGMEINFAMLNAIDLITTFYSVDKGAKEVNPVANLFIRNKPLAVVIKGGLTAGVLYGLSQVKKDDKTAAYLTLGLLNIMYGLVVKNNFGVYLKLSK